MNKDSVKLMTHEERMKLILSIHPRFEIIQKSARSAGVSLYSKSDTETSEESNENNKTFTVRKVDI